MLEHKLYNAYASTYPCTYTALRYTVLAPAHVALPGTARISLHGAMLMI